jgi:threonine/homoserine/homoserine lactone efflux protein
MLFEGFAFGMLLQLAIGPVCLYVLNTAITKGFAAAFISTAGVTLADAVYITLALAGISGLSKNKKTQILFRITGGIVLVLFGLDIILNTFGYGLMPGIPGPQKTDNSAGFFLFAFLLTLSNPLTIIFWSGIFALKINEKGKNKGNLPLFGLGAVLSTLVFLSAVAGLGSFFHFYLPGQAIKLLNLAAGIAITIYGIFFFSRKTAGT